MQRIGTFLLADSKSRAAGICRAVDPLKTNHLQPLTAGSIAGRKAGYKQLAIESVDAGWFRFRGNFT
jgi:hypothetical protein